MSTVTFTGNLAEDVELRYTPNGRAVARFRVLENRRTRDANGEWTDAEPNAWRVQVWGNMAENVAASCTKGSRVHVTGEVHTDVWQDKETKQTRRAQKIEADEVSFSLRFHTVQATKATQRDGSEAAQPVADPTPLHPQTSWPSVTETPAPPAHTWETAAIPTDDQPR